MLNSEGFVPKASISEKWKFITEIVKNTDILQLSLFTRNCDTVIWYLKKYILSIFGISYQYMNYGRFCDI